MYLIEVKYKTRRAITGSCEPLVVCFYLYFSIVFLKYLRKLVIKMFTVHQIRGGLILKGYLFNYRSV